MAYIFAHFKEKITRDGEQVYFAVSKDGYTFESLNGGEPVLESKKGTRGCRDIELVPLHKGGFVIITTDLCIVDLMDENYNVNWKYVNSHGSKNLTMWKSDDLIHFEEQKQIYFGRDDFGCLWAPEVFFDEINEEYIIHFGSTNIEDNYTHMKIYYTKTKDFESFTYPEVFFEKDNEILDSHLVKADDTYHLFYKNSENPSGNMHAVSKELFGKYEDDEAFWNIMNSYGSPGSYEGPTTYKLPNGKWCLMLDFFGCEKSKMGYVPFVSSSVGDCSFKMDKESFTFPYGFKHGCVKEISDELYIKLKKHYNK